MSQRPCPSHQSTWVGVIGAAGQTMIAITPWQHIAVECACSMFLLSRGYFDTRNEIRQVKIILCITPRRPHNMLSHEWKNSGQKSTFEIFTKTEHNVNLLKLIDKLWKFEMDPVDIQEDTERTRFGLQEGQTDRQTDIRTDGRQSETGLLHQRCWRGIKNIQVYHHCF